MFWRKQKNIRPRPKIPEMLDAEKVFNATAWDKLNFSEFGLSLPQDATLLFYSYAKELTEKLIEPEKPGATPLPLYSYEYHPVTPPPELMAKTPETKINELLLQYNHGKKTAIVDVLNKIEHLITAAIATETQRIKEELTNGYPPSRHRP